MWVIFWEFNKVVILLLLVMSCIVSCWSELFEFFRNYYFEWFLMLMLICLFRFIYLMIMCRIGGIKLIFIVRCCELSVMIKLMNLRKS